MSNASYIKIQFRAYAKHVFFIDIRIYPWKKTDHSAEGNQHLMRANAAERQRGTMKRFQIRINLLMDTNQGGALIQFGVLRDQKLQTVKTTAENGAGKRKQMIRLALTDTESRQRG